jgi:hypothetical protein
VHGVFSGADPLHQHGEERAVLQHLDGVAGNGGTQRQAGQRGDELIDRRVALDQQNGIAMPPDRPDDDPQQHENAKTHEPGNKGHLAKEFIHRTDTPW